MQGMYYRGWIVVNCGDAGGGKKVTCWQAGVQSFGWNLASVGERLVLWGLESEGTETVGPKGTGDRRPEGGTCWQTYVCR